MKEVKIEITVETGFAGCNHDDILTITVADNATADEIAEQAEEEAKNYFNNCCSYGFHYVECCEACGGNDDPAVWRERFSSAMCEKCVNNSILNATGSDTGK